MVSVDQRGPGAPPTPPEPLTRVFSDESVSEAVAQNDLEQIGVRPRLGTYFK